VLALTRIGQRDARTATNSTNGGSANRAILEEAKSDSPAVRMAVLLTLRRWESPEVARFLDDTDPKIVAEAARAIYDLPIDAALPTLAKMIEREGLSNAILYRVLNANFRLGKAENAAAVASFAARAKAPEALRVEALKELSDWATPPGRDRVMGLWRPLEPRAESIAVDAVRSALGGIFSGPDKVRQEGAKLAAKFGIKEVGPTLFEMVADAKRPTDVRIETLRALNTLKDERLDRAIRIALHDQEPTLRTEGRRLLAKRNPDQAVASLEKALDAGPTIERQGAFAILGEMQEPAAEALLARWMDKLLAKETPPEIQLDLLEAAAKHPTQGLKNQLAKFDAARSKSDHLAQYRETLAGGDAEAGRRIFFYKQDAQCLKCHKVDGVGGEVGPELKGIGARQNREYLLESIVTPNKQIAKGYESVRISTKKGLEIVGIIKAEDDKEVKLMTPEGRLLTIAKAQIDERRAEKSAMPEDLLKYLSKSELRDLVEFLAGLK
jgi:quinoprotein glucose dehydrogenase